MTEQQRRDIELVLLGVALAKSERDRVLVLAPGSFTREVEPLIDAIRTQKPKVLAEWLADRGVVLEKGRDFVYATVARVSDLNVRDRLNQIGTQLAHSRGCETTEQMLVRFKNALKQIEDLA